MTKRARVLFPVMLLGAAVSSLTVVACSIAVKKDLSAIPAGQVGFDDMCGLQDYFDSLEAKVAKEPVVASSLDLEGGDGQKTVRGGKVRLLYQGDFLLKNARRVLDDNWTRLPETLATTDKIELEGRWAERAGVKRLVTDQDAELIVDGKSYYIPYQACLSEFMFGAPLYKQRQVLWGLPNPSAVAAKPLNPPPAASAPDGGTRVINSTPDAGAPMVKPSPPAK